MEPQSSKEALARIKESRIESNIDGFTTATVLFRAGIYDLKSIHCIEVADLKKIVE